MKYNNPVKNMRVQLAKTAGSASGPETLASSPLQHRDEEVKMVSASHISDQTTQVLVLSTERMFVPAGCQETAFTPPPP